MFYSTSYPSSCSIGNTGDKYTIIAADIPIRRRDAMRAFASSMLILVNVIFRHGDRTPDHGTSFPNDPHRNNNFHPYGKGELTLRGKQRSYKFGENIRERYKNFLGPYYHQGIVEATSTELARTQMTLQIVLAALFPPSTENQLRPGYMWQPIAYNTLRKSDDKVLGTFYNCPRIIAVDSIYKPTKEEYALYEYLSAHSGQVVERLLSVVSIHNTLLVQEELGYERPIWAKHVWSTMEQTAVQYFKLLASQNLNFTVGNFLNKIAKDCKDKSMNAPNLESRKLFLYSAHDINIIALLGALENYFGEKINYNAHIIFELHLLDGVHGMKIFFQNDETPNPRPLKLLGCGYFCPIDKFVEFAEKLKPNEAEWKKC